MARESEESETVRHEPVSVRSFFPPRHVAESLFDASANVSEVCLMASNRVMATLRDKAGKKWHAIVMIGTETTKGSRVYWYATSPSRQP